MKKLYLVVLLSSLIISNAGFTVTSLEKYCIASGGKVEKMPIRYSTMIGDVIGQSRYFCTFKKDGGFIVIGLRTFASTKPSIAATYIKRLHPFAENSELWSNPGNSGSYSNPSLHVCANLGGTSVAIVTSGGFFNELGESDICVFGDGSMVSAWSLIYMANDRQGYSDIKNKVRSEPLELPFLHLN